MQKRAAKKGLAFIFNSRGRGQTGQKFATKVGVAHLKKNTQVSHQKKITKHQVLSSLNISGLHTKINPVNICESHVFQSLFQSPVDLPGTPNCKLDILRKLELTLAALALCYAFRNVLRLCFLCCVTEMQFMMHGAVRRSAIKHWSTFYPLLGWKISRVTFL